MNIYFICVQFLLFSVIKLAILLVLIFDLSQRPYLLNTCAILRFYIVIMVIVTDNICDTFFYILNNKLNT